MIKAPRVCNEIGHGMGSRKPGEVDPGAEVLGAGNEASIMKVYVNHLDNDLDVLFRGHPGSLSMVRDVGYYADAIDEAVARKCKLFQGHHVNATKVRAKRDGKEVGVEVLYEDPKDAAYARNMAAACAKAAGLPNRGAKRVTDLAVLQPRAGVTQIIIEFFFGSDADDVRAWDLHRHDVELAELNTMLGHWHWKKVKSLPRKWSAEMQDNYRKANV